jgi:hypothetical protein
MSCSVEIEEVESESRNRGPGGHRLGGPEAVYGHGRKSSPRASEKKVERRLRACSQPLGA